MEMKIIEDKIIINSLKINNLNDLAKLKTFKENNQLKTNIKKLVQELNVSRTTAYKYLNGFEKSKNRCRKSQFDDYKELIIELLNSDIKVFNYKSVLYRYLVDNHRMKGAESSFRCYLLKQDEINELFKKHKPKSSVNKTIRYETSPGQQAQLDWKESQKFVLKTGEVIEYNVFCLVLSYSRFRTYLVSLSKERDIVKHFLDKSFETFGGVPKTILCDNMKTIMDDSRKEYKSGKINDEMVEYSNDYGFEFKPCIANKPDTKGKVESPMRILDELAAYNGDLTYEELLLKIVDINNRENTRFHPSYQMIPILGLNKEKDFLLPLPKETIRNQYTIQTQSHKVNNYSLISYKSKEYSVPPKYVGKKVQLQVIDNQIYIYYNKQLITIHSISNKKINYSKDHYIELSKNTFNYKDEQDIEAIASENLRMIGERYNEN